VTKGIFSSDCLFVEKHRAMSLSVAAKKLSELPKDAKKRLPLLLRPVPPYMTIRPRVAAKKWSGTTPDNSPTLVFDDNESAEERSFQPTSSGDEGGRE
jgi:hypothetical protein